eukprot:4972512-Prymnesium_polylepis.1
MDDERASPTRALHCLPRSGDQIAVRATATAAHYSFSTPPPDDGMATHALKHRTCFTQALVLLEPRHISYTVHNRHARAASSCTSGRYTSQCVHITDCHLERPPEVLPPCVSERRELVLQPDQDGSERP